jgi:hypothetical protein
MLAHRSSDGDLLLEAHHCRWSTALFQGDVAGNLAVGTLSNLPNRIVGSSPEWAA